MFDTKNRKAYGIAGVLSSAKNNKVVFIFISIAIVAQITDMSLARVSLFVNDESSTRLRTAFFVVLSIACIIGQYFLAAYVRYSTREITKDKAYLRFVHRATKIYNYIFTFIILLVILQIGIASRYNVSLLIVAMTISYSFATVMLALLSYRYLSWLRTNRSIVVILYTFTSAMLAINALVTLVFVDLVLVDMPVYIRMHVDVISQIFNPDSLIDRVNTLYIWSSILSYFVAWLATATFLLQHSRKFGRTIYWLIISMPLIYFLAQFQPLILNVLGPLRESYSILFGLVYTVTFSISKPLGGILFGIAFWLTARKLTDTIITREYLYISAYGLVLFFVSNQAIVLLNGDYPPFGLPSVSFVGLSSYTILIGIYSTAVYISKDVNFRRELKKITLQQYNLLDNIGTAEMQNELERRVFNIAKDHLNDYTMADEGVKTSLSVEEFKSYFDDIQDEIVRMRKTSEQK